MNLPILKTRPDMAHPYPAVGVDFETYYDDECTIKKLGVWGYTHHPKFVPYIVAIDDGEQSFVGDPADFDWTSLEGRMLISHNRTFEWSVYLRMVELGIAPAVEFAEWACTADLACYLKAGRALDKVVKNFLHRAASKNVRAKQKGLLPEQMRQKMLVQKGKGTNTKLIDLSEPLAQQKLSDGSGRPFWEDVCEYVAGDVKDILELWNGYSHEWPEFERRLSLMTGRSCTRGFKINRPDLENDVLVLRAEMDAARARMPWADDLPTDEGVQSVPAMKAAIEALGLVPPAATGEDSLELQEWEKANPTCTFTKDMRDFRKAGILIKRCQVLLDRSDPETDEFSFALRYYGAEKTGRWAGGSSDRQGGWNETGFNVHNFPKEPLLGVDLRKRIIARPGKKFIVSDAAQIEPRCTAWLTNDQHKLELMRSGVSVYQIHAVETMGHDPAIDLKKTDKDRYQLSKVRVLGLGYQCGHIKFRDYAATQYQYFMTLQESKRNVRDFRAKEKLIVRAWNRLQHQFECSNHDTYQIELPSGRTLDYFEVQQHGREWIARRTLGGQFNKYYGGKLFENLVQATARDVFGYQMQAVEDEFGEVVLFHVHDELIAEVDCGVSVKEFEQVMAVCPDWIEGLPVAVEAHESDFYLK